MYYMFKILIWDHNNFARVTSAKVPILGLDLGKLVIRTYGLFGQTILPIPFHSLGWAKWFENGLEWFEKKNMLNGLTL